MELLRESARILTLAHAVRERTRCLTANRRPDNKAARQDTRSTPNNGEIHIGASAQRRRLQSVGKFLAAQA
jgi:hypothetical protein